MAAVVVVVSIIVSDNVEHFLRMGYVASVKDVGIRRSYTNSIVANNNFHLDHECNYFAWQQQTFLVCDIEKRIHTILLGKRLVSVFTSIYVF